MPRPKFVPTKDQRLTVKTLSAYGINHEGIARKIGLRSPKTLRKRFPEELALGAIEAVAQVSQTHYQMAKSGKYPASTMHFLNTRARWLDVQTVSPVDDESKDAEKREISRIIWRVSEQPKPPAEPTSPEPAVVEAEKQQVASDEPDDAPPNDPEDESMPD